MVNLICSIIKIIVKDGYRTVLCNAEIVVNKNSSNYNTHTSSLVDGRASQKTK